MSSPFTNSTDVQANITRITLNPKSGALVTVKSERRLILAYSTSSIMDHLASSFGRWADKMARRHRWGVDPTTEDIMNILASLGQDSEGKEDREILLCKLRAASKSGDPLPKLAEACQRLMKYTRPTQTVETQMGAFRKIVMFTTNYPGLRLLFLQFNGLKQAKHTRAAVEHLWNRTFLKDNAYRREWEFFYDFAMQCLSGGEIAEEIENCPITNMGLVRNNDQSWVMDKLMFKWTTCEFYDISGFIAMRYLGGILQLPTFWLEDNHDHHQLFTRKLFLRIRKVLEDVGLGGEGSLGSEEHVVDMGGIDIVARAALVGVHKWSQIVAGNLEGESWVGEFRKVVKLLSTPKAREIFPDSSKEAVTLFCEFNRDHPPPKESEVTNDSDNTESHMEGSRDQVSQILHGTNASIAEQSSRQESDSAPEEEPDGRPRADERSLHESLTEEKKDEEPEEPEDDVHLSPVVTEAIDTLEDAELHEGRSRDRTSQTLHDAETPIVEELSELSSKGSDSGLEERPDGRPHAVERSLHEPLEEGRKKDQPDEPEGDVPVSPAAPEATDDSEDVASHKGKLPGKSAQEWHLTEESSPIITSFSNYSRNHSPPVELEVTDDSDLAMSSTNLVGEEKNDNDLEQPKSDPFSLPIFEQYMTPGSGLGYRSNRDPILKGTLLFEERPLFCLPESHNAAHVQRIVDSQTPRDRGAFFSLQLPHQFLNRGDYQGRFLANALACVTENGTRVAGLFLKGARFNHSCRPNVQYRWDRNSQRMRFYAIKNIRYMEELCISYDEWSILLPRPARKQRLLELAGFQCNCPSCVTHDITSDDRRIHLKETIGSIERMFTTPTANPHEYVVRNSTIINALSTLHHEGICRYRDHLYYVGFRNASTAGDGNNAMLWLNEAWMAVNVAGGAQSDFGQILAQLLASTSAEQIQRGNTSLGSGPPLLPE
ncbi:hypothetical protein FRC14_000992 [Serendipita sp. 396]|nr:hypothetical protein FRC14_000992 [Serendipita sp. 396]KAG8876684.1 hypothetical protein FRC20_001022 [Serendipita sp. 405]